MNAPRAAGARAAFRDGWSGTRAPALWALALLVVSPLALLLPAAPATAADLELDAGFDTEVAGLGEAVGFWIEVRAGYRQPPGIEPAFELDNLEQIGDPVTQKSFRFIDGSAVPTLRVTWLLRPLAVGQAAVRGIRVRIGGEVFELPTERLEVREKPAPSDRRLLAPGSSSVGPRPPSRRRPLLPDPMPLPLSAGNVFLRAEVEPQRPWVGQQVLYTLFLYTQADINSIYPRRVPPFQGFWAHEVTLPRQPTPEMVEVDGRRYGRVPLLKRVLFPRRPGLFEVEAAEYDLIAQIRRTARSGVRSRQPQQITRRANPLSIEVRELPTAPPGFTGAVGHFELSAQLFPRNVPVGEAATLEVTLRGDGHIQALPPPGPPELPGVTVYPPEERDSNGEGTDTLVGQRSWSFVLVPEQVGRWRIEGFELTFFDPQAGGFRVARAAPPTLVSHTPEHRTAVASPGPGSGLHPIRSAAVPASTGFRGRSLLPWLAGLPLALTLLVRIAQRRAAGRSETRELLDRLSVIERSDAGEGLAANRHAADQIESAWSGFLAARWKVPPDTPAARWADALGDNAGPGSEVAEPLRRLAEEIHYLRHAPQLSTTGGLRRELLDHSRRMARRLPAPRLR